MKWEVEKNGLKFEVVAESESDLKIYHEEDFFIPDYAGQYKGHWGFYFSDGSRFGEKVVGRKGPIFLTHDIAKEVKAWQVEQKEIRRQELLNTPLAFEVDKFTYYAFDMPGWIGYALRPN